MPESDVACVQVSELLPNDTRGGKASCSTVSSRGNIESAPFSSESVYRWKRNNIMIQMFISKGKSKIHAAHYKNSISVKSKVTKINSYSTNHAFISITFIIVAIIWNNSSEFWRDGFNVIARYIWMSTLLSEVFQNNYQNSITSFDMVVPNKQLVILTILYGNRYKGWWPGSWQKQFVIVFFYDKFKIFQNINYLGMIQNVIFIHFSSQQFVPQLF